MPKKSNYTFSCPEFHQHYSLYQDFRGCTYSVTDSLISEVKRKAKLHLNGIKDPKDPQEHHYQDNPGINIDADVDAYLYGLYGEK